MCFFAPPGSHLGFLDSSRGDDPQDEDFLIFAEFALVSQRRRHALTLGLNPAYQHSRNAAHGSLAIRLYCDHFYGVSAGSDQDEEENEPLLTAGHYAEDSSHVSDASSCPDQRFSASAEDSEPPRLPAPAGKRKKKQKHIRHQRGAASAAEEGGGGRSSGPGTRRRSRVPETPHSCTETDKEDKKKRPSQRKHTSKDCCTDTSKKRSKRDKKGASKKGQRAEKDGENAHRGMRTLRYRIFPERSSDKCVVKGTNGGRGQRVTEEEKRSRKKKKGAKQSANQEGRSEEAVTGTSRRRKRKDESKSNGRQRSGAQAEDPPPPPKKKKCQWIIDLFKGKTKAASSAPQSKEDPASAQKRKR